jgi:hypothetical protein
VNVDQTAARDRAIEVIEAVMPADTVHTRDYGTVGIAPEVGDIVDALLANPEVLRALAGVPTADVAACTCPMDEMHPACDKHGQPSAAYAVGRDEGQRLEREAGYAQRPTAVDEDYDQGRGIPEGVDAADEQDEDPGEAAHLAEMTRQNIARAIDTGERLVWSDGDVATVMERLEAQGAMADELTAAQAANQRVDAVCTNDAVGLTRGVWWVRRTDVLRALDGDTTEES